MAHFPVTFCNNSDSWSNMLATNGRYKDNCPTLLQQQESSESKQSGRLGPKQSTRCFALRGIFS